MPETYTPKRGRCRQSGCPNTFAEVIGGEGWGMTHGKRPYGDCLPCFFAAQLHDLKISPDSIADGELGAQMGQFLARTGWSWEQLVDSFNRHPHPVIM